MNPLNQEPNTVDVIIPNLYLGDKNAATDLELVSKLELTHILSVDMIPLPQVSVSTVLELRCKKNRRNSEFYMHRFLLSQLT